VNSFRLSINSRSRVLRLPVTGWLGVYSAEIGYEYSGEEYWQTFAERTPGWAGYGDRNFIRDLRELAGKIEVGDEYRKSLITLVDGVGPFSISGKNCKAPLMSFGVGS
jgi:hypothetical protein